MRHRVVYGPNLGLQFPDRLTDLASELEYNVLAEAPGEIPALHLGQTGWGHPGTPVLMKRLEHGTEIALQTGAFVLKHPEREPTLASQGGQKASLRPRSKQCTPPEP